MYNSSFLLEGLCYPYTESVKTLRSVKNPASRCLVYICTYHQLQALLCECELLIRHELVAKASQSEDFAIFVQRASMQRNEYLDRKMRAVARRDAARRDDVLDGDGDAEQWRALRRLRGPEDHAQAQPREQHWRWSSDGGEHWRQRTLAAATNFGANADRRQRALAATNIGGDEQHWVHHRIRKLRGGAIIFTYG